MMAEFPGPARLAIDARGAVVHADVLAAFVDVLALLAADGVRQIPTDADQQILWLHVPAARQAGRLLELRPNRG